MPGVDSTPVASDRTESDSLSEANAPSAGPASGASADGPKRPPRPRSESSTAKSSPAHSNGGSLGPKAKRTAPKKTVKGTPPRRAKDPEPSVEPEPDTGDDPTLITDSPPVLKPAPVPPPMATPESGRRPRPADRNETAGVDRSDRRRGRRVHRIVRRIDLWSVLKLSVVLYTCLYAVILGTFTVLWGVLYSSGQIERLQSFLADVGMHDFRFYGDQMFRAIAAIGAIAVLAGTIITVLTAALVNVISEMTGGIRVVVIEEEPPRR